MSFLSSSSSSSLSSLSISALSTSTLSTSTLSSSLSSLSKHHHQSSSSKHHHQHHQHHQHHYHYYHNHYYHRHHYHHHHYHHHHYHHYHHHHYQHRYHHHYHHHYHHYYHHHYCNIGGGYPRQSSNDDLYYNILGVSKQATADEIKKSYRKLAIKKHPDKGGNEEEFKKIVEAYEILSDDEKRAVYDRYGQAGLNGNSGNMNSGGNPFGGGGFGGFEDLFRGFGSFQVPLVFQLDLSLEDFFTGKDYTIPINNARVKIVIQPGMYGGQELILRNRVVDPRAGGPGRDLVFRLREIRHPIFQRKNADLLMEIKINLTDALLGFEYKFQHLDGTTVSIKSKPGDVAGADAVLMVPSLGMPIYDQPKQRGRLFVKCKLQLPKKLWLEGEELENLEMLLITAKDKRKIAKNAYMAKYHQNKDNAETIAAVAETIAAVIDSNTISSNNSDINLNRNNNRNSTNININATKPESMKIKTEKEKPKNKSNSLILLQSDINEFGKVGSREDEDDPDASPFTHYFFR